MVQRLRTIAPWLNDSDLPVLRAFAELEYLSRRVFALLREEGLVSPKTGDARKLLGEYRSLRTAQRSIADSLGLTPMARKELTSKDAGGLDFAVEMTKAMDAEVVTPEEAAPGGKPDGNAD
jgi:hypothetical protein